MVSSCHRTRENKTRWPWDNIDRQTKHQHTEGCFWHVKETGSIKRTFGGHSSTDLTVSLVCDTVRLPKERCSLPKWSLWEKSVTCTHNPHSTGNHQGKIRVSVVLFGFSLSICYLNPAMCCNALCPKGLSVLSLSKCWEGDDRCSSQDRLWLQTAATQA